MDYRKKCLFIINSLACVKAHTYINSSDFELGPPLPVSFFSLNSTSICKCNLSPPGFAKSIFIYRYIALSYSAIYQYHLDI